MSRKFFSGVLAAAFFGFPALAGGVPDLSGPVVLTVTGLDLSTYPGGEVQFDIPGLRALGELTFTTATIWTSGTHSYTGTPVAAVLRALEVRDGRLVLHAINDYVVEMPVAEVEDHAPILAFDMDGAPMSVRDKGPIWVIYPFDDDAHYQTDTMFARSVWQLDRIDVLR